MGKNKKKKNKNKGSIKGASAVANTEDTLPELTEKAEPTIETLDELAVEIDDEVYAKIMHWIDKADGEVSGLGKVELVNGVMRVTSAILLKQENTSVTTDIDAAAVGKAMFELKDSPGQLNWWWHSHVNMDVFWSGTDLDTIHKIGQGGWFLSTVLNKKREMLSAYFQKGNGHLPPLFIDNIPTSTQTYVTEEQTKIWDKEFSDKVTEKKFTSYFLPGKTSYSQSFGLGGQKQSYEGATVYNADNTIPYDEQTHYRFQSEFDKENDDRDLHEDVSDYTDEEFNDLVLRAIAREEKEAQKRAQQRKANGNKKKGPIT
jgi:hypothetical protein